jgi:hypothetical protein
MSMTVMQPTPLRAMCMGRNRSTQQVYTLASLIQV